MNDISPTRIAQIVQLAATRKANPKTSQLQRNDKLSQTRRTTTLTDNIERSITGKPSNQQVEIIATQIILLDQGEEFINSPSFKPMLDFVMAALHNSPELKKAIADIKQKY